MKKLFLVIFLAVSLTYCAWPFDRYCCIGILNKSDYTIFIYNSYSDSLSFIMTNSVDTAYTFDSGITVYSPNRAEPDSIAYLSFRGTHADIFDLLGEKLRIFIFTEETIRKYSWEEICEYQMYEKKLTLTEEELKKNDWTVVYE
jgi:hypothetical protein